MSPAARLGKELLLCGLGLKPGHITAEVLAALKNCDAVFTYSPGSDGAGYLKGLCPRNKLRLVTGPAAVSAAAIVREILASPSCRRAVYLAHGNPRFISDPVFELDRRARAAGLKVSALDAVSSFDAVVNALGLNKFSPQGLRLVRLDAALKWGGPALTPAMDTCFFMPWLLLEKERGALLAEFLAGIKKSYPPGSFAWLVDCGSFSGINGRAVKVRVSELEKKLLLAGADTTLYLPAAAPKPAAAGK